MPEYDWMTDPAFRDEVKDAVVGAARRGGMKHYQSAIVDRLMQHLQNNRQVLLEQEQIKTASLRKNKSEALESVSTLVKRASEIAANNKRTLVEATDFDQAYKEKFCMVWPFCGKGK